LLPIRTQLAQLPDAALYLDTVAVIRTPYASYTLVDALDRLMRPLQLLAAGVSEQLHLLQDLERLQVSNADGLLTTVDVMADDDGVFPRPWRYRDLDLGVFGRELWKLRLDEGAVLGVSERNG